MKTFLESKRIVSSCLSPKKNPSLGYVDYLTGLKIEVLNRVRNLRKYLQRSNQPFVSKTIGNFEKSANPFDSIIRRRQ